MTLLTRYLKLHKHGIAYTSLACFGLYIIVSQWSSFQPAIVQGTGVSDQVSIPDNRTNVSNQVSIPNNRTNVSNQVSIPNKRTNVSNQVSIPNKRTNVSNQVSIPNNRTNVSNQVSIPNKRTNVSNQVSIPNKRTNVSNQVTIPNKRTNVSNQVSIPNKRTNVSNQVSIPYEQTDVSNQTNKTSLKVPISELPSYLNVTEVYTASKVIDKFLQRLNGDTAFEFSIESLREQSYELTVQPLGLAKKLSSRRLSVFKNTKIKEDDPNYKKFHYGIRQNALYDPADPAIEGLLRDIGTQKIVNASIPHFRLGSSLKLVLTFENGGKALFKPMRMRRDEFLPDCHVGLDYERHYAEIAAYHISRTLGFHMVPPATGRVVNITADIRPFVDKDFSETFYVNSGGQICFYGTCRRHCKKNKRYSACGSPELIECVLKALLPEGHGRRIQSFRYPYVRPDHAVKQHWQRNTSFCKDYVMHLADFNTTKAILDLTDHSVFLFMIGDIDSFLLEHFDDFGQGGQILFLDNGRGFCTAEDDLVLLGPLRQCCKIRRSTFLKLAKLYIGPAKFSEIVDNSMTKDPLYPILTNVHLRSLDRRVVFALQAIAECMKDGVSVNDIILND